MNDPRHPMLFSGLLVLLLSACLTAGTAGTSLTDGARWPSATLMPLLVQTVGLP